MQKNTKLGLWRIIVTFILIFGLGLSVFWYGYSLGKKGADLSIGDKKVINTTVGSPSDIDFSLYWEAWNKLKDKSVYDLDPQKMIYGSISGLMSSLGDPYTTFFTPEDNKRFKEDIQGEFSGIGVEIVSKNGLPTVVAPLSGSPAEKAGIKAGDIIAKIDDKKTSEVSFNEAINLIRGEKDTKVKLEIVRAGVDAPINIEVVRDAVVVKSVEWKDYTESGKKLMYVKVSQFGDDTDQLFGQFVDEAVKANPDGIIVDLRNDPGGYLETAINLSSYFLDGGVVVQEQGKDKQVKQYKVTKPARLKNFKTVILVNQGSASASEIFSGALQDRKAGTLIGEKTFGKGSVQELIELTDGSAAKITVAKWSTPNGRQINELGIEPDIAVVANTDITNDNVLARAFEFFTNGK
ncbi:MAG: S41 family peptidase [bacterium]